MNMRSILFGAIVGSVGLVACGGDSSSNNTADGGLTVDSGTADMQVRRDATVAATFTFTTSQTAQASGSAYLTANQAAGAESLAAQCECFFFSAGYESAEACVTDNAPVANTYRDMCTTTAYDAAPATVKGFLSCLSSLGTQMDDCLTTFECGEASAQCFGADEGEEATAYDDAFDACATGVSQTDYDVYTDALSTCLIGTGTDTCGTGTPSSAIGAAAITGTTQGAGDHRTATMAACGTSYAFGASPDKTIRWTAPSAGTFRFDTTGTDFDTVLYAIEDGTPACTAETPTFLGCNDDASAMTPTSSLSLTLAAGQTIQIVIDGYSASNGDFGDFVINIEQVGGTTTDAGVDAAAPADAGVDAAEPDAAEPDAAEPDAAEPDAAEPDAAG